MNNILLRISKYMYGRYGNDQLNHTILATSIALYFLGNLTHIIFILFISIIGLGITLFRCLSKNITKRQFENEKFVKIISRFSENIRSCKCYNLVKLKYKYRKTHKIFLCPKCKQTIRIPKDIGKVEVTCPKCHFQMIKKS